MSYLTWCGKRESLSDRIPKHVTTQVTSHITD